MSVAERLEEARARIVAACARSGRAPAEVRLIAVSKLQSDHDVRAAYAAGQRIFGENFVQALVLRAGMLPPDAEWHLIGHLQTNKAKTAAEKISMLHTVDGEKIARAIAAAPQRKVASLPVLIQVNISGEVQKHGVGPESVEPLCDRLRRVEGVELVGLMCIPDPKGETRPAFSALRALRDRVRAASGLVLPELSMGMSDDFENAVLEGATLVRIGSYIFGPRPAV